MHYDIFNGDADGIIALLQLRLAQPKDSVLITGVKRDIALIKQLPHEQLTEADSATVLDISLEKNVDALQRILKQGVKVFYVDHHRAGDIPKSSLLTTLINTDANTCTSLLVNEYLKGKYLHWAIAAAFGDNMTASAITLSKQAGLSESEQQSLKSLGIYINYNGYGRTVDDLHYSPVALYNELLAYPEPLALLDNKSSVFYQLEKAYLEDMEKAQAAKVLAETAVIKVVELEDAPWAHRVSGVFGNALANAAPDIAHAVLTPNVDGSYTVSVRAPLNNKQGADKVCIQFPTGGGRSAAAGINQLPEAQLPHFIETLSNYYA